MCLPDDAQHHFRAAIQTLAPIDDEGFAILSKSIYKKSMEVDELLWDAGDPCRHIVFVLRGDTFFTFLK